MSRMANRRSPHPLPPPMIEGVLESWLRHLETLHPREMELGLKRVSTVGKALDLLDPQVPVITVAGTNGKGSVVAVSEALLLAAGRRPGAFTSPHFLNFNERIRICGEDASDQEIIAAFESIEAARNGVSLTYFEFATLAALQIFREREVDVMILEVGLGGRLDASNMIDPTVAVITSIALDHQAWLGESLGAIAREKAGIIRPGRPLVLAQAEPPPELVRAAADTGATPVLCFGRDFTVTTEVSSRELQFVDHAGNAVVLPFPSVEGLLPQNISAALQAVCLLGVGLDEAQLVRALQGLKLTGRLQRHHLGGLDYVLDVAHNPAAVEQLVETLQTQPFEGKTLALFSAMADKDIATMLASVVPVVDAWFLAEQTDNPRAASASDIAGILRNMGESMISVSKNLRQAFRRAQGLMSGGDRLVVFGSFSTVAGVLPLLEKDRRKNLAGAVS